ncbi:MAG TPA: FAD:protein FMN transferase [Bacillales bacterium]|nr:FAD:protein FMN transferase [Bacillales bacterium]
MMRKTKLFMDTVVDIRVVTGHSISEEEIEMKINHAFDAFRKVEQACSRFNPESELMRSSREINKPIPISPYLFEPLKFALEIAKGSNGLFDPTIGKLMENYGFNQNYLTEKNMESTTDTTATFSDIVLNEYERSLLLKKPLVIDLGAVAKGFAIDLAANELKECDGFIVNAGGDVFAGGINDKFNRWSIGIQHLYQQEKVIDCVEISNEAICTSGSYERRSAKNPSMHHLINPRTKRSENHLVSLSIIAPFAMMADAFSTVAFLSGVTKSKEIVESTGVKGIFIKSDLDIVKVGGI